MQFRNGLGSRLDGEKRRPYRLHDRQGGDVSRRGEGSDGTEVARGLSQPRQDAQFLEIGGGAERHSVGLQPAGEATRILARRAAGRSLGLSHHADAAGGAVSRDGGGGGARAASGAGAAQGARGDGRRGDLAGFAAYSGDELLSRLAPGGEGAARRGVAAAAGGELPRRHSGAGRRRRRLHADDDPRPGAGAARSGALSGTGARARPAARGVGRRRGRAGAVHARRRGGDAGALSRL